MSNTPLTSTDHSKIVLFALLMIPTLFFVGVLPVLFLIIGFFMLRRTKDFSYIELAVRGAAIYIWIGIALCLGVVVWHGLVGDRDSLWERHYNEMMMQNVAIAGVIAFGYQIALTRLLYSPLLAHKEWVEQNGVFASKAKNQESSEIDIIKGERLKSFSVADELIKWAKLKDDGHISEQEFNDARKKLLQRD
ncbi:SHOCT domain-containing protein [Pseudomonas veronii]|uniref:SHOCT domain-containing protein n=1 Tax=Pseudomonas veronii TaxID=76761 RepID=A0A7Y1FDQ1_PSEVE|nr:SHOCT domain-containing protein [Pseudomonas veronii]NMY13807.1 SHOCT domain-containing protein [Pseudomonas veronii]